MLTPERMKMVVASLLKAVVERQDVAAARLLFDRLLGKPRAEVTQPLTLDLPDGLATSSEIAAIAQTLLRSMAAGEMAPEDAQRGAMVVEAARRAMETDVLAQRVTALENKTMRRDS